MFLRGYHCRIVFTLQAQQRKETYVPYIIKVAMCAYDDSAFRVSVDNRFKEQLQHAMEKLDDYRLYDFDSIQQIATENQNSPYEPELYRDEPSPSNYPQHGEQAFRGSVFVVLCRRVWSNSCRISGHWKDKGGDSCRRAQR
jgi:hypothetical protein